MSSLLLILAMFHFGISYLDAHETSLCVNFCPPCLPQRIASECPPEPTCEEKVKQPGCGCCMVCALQEGERCGVNRPDCGNGLRCLTKRGKFRLIDILENRGTCQQISAIANDAKSSKRKTSHNSRRRKHKKQRGRRVTRHPHYGLLSPLNHNGPCSRHYEEMMTSCGTLPVQVWLPTCDNHGYYSSKQCMSSKGAQPGKCWCVNRNGFALQGSPFTRDELFCH